MELLSEILPISRFDGTTRSAVGRGISSIWSSTHAHARTRARAHARTRARVRTCTHTNIHTRCLTPRSRVSHVYAHHHPSSLAHAPHAPPSPPCARANSFTYPSTHQYTRTIPTHTHKISHRCAQDAMIKGGEEGYHPAYKRNAVAIGELVSLL